MSLTRQIVVRLASTVERRLGGRRVKSLAIWLGDLADRVDGGAEAVAEMLARGVVEGSFEPAGILPGRREVPRRRRSTS